MRARGEGAGGERGGRLPCSAPAPLPHPSPPTATSLRSSHLSKQPTAVGELVAVGWVGRHPLPPRGRRSAPPPRGRAGSPGARPATPAPAAGEVLRVKRAGGSWRGSGPGWGRRRGGPGRHGCCPAQTGPGHDSATAPTRRGAACESEETHLNHDSARDSLTARLTHPTRSLPVCWCYNRDSQSNHGYGPGPAGHRDRYCPSRSIRF